MTNNILIIDDEQDVITYLMAVLEANGFNPYSCRDTKSAMEKLESISTDLVCLDIMMPRETGISFYTKLKQSEKYKNIPIIIISGAIESGNFDFRNYVSDISIPEPEYYFEKPIDVNEFIGKINELLNIN
jgi:DNA-binding response OmpR family regulator